MFYDSRPVGAVPLGVSPPMSDVADLLYPPLDSLLPDAEKRERAKFKLIDLEIEKAELDDYICGLDDCVRQLREFLSVDPRQATFWDVPVDDDGLAV